jgi:hypothetical protein
VWRPALIASIVRGADDACGGSEFVAPELFNVVAERPPREVTAVAS